MATKTKAAARCKACGKAFAVWQFAEGNVVPIGSADGCSCGGTTFQVLASSEPSD